MRRVCCNGTAWMALAPSRLIGSKHLEWKKWNKWKVSNRGSPELDTDRVTPRARKTKLTDW